MRPLTIKDLIDFLEQYEDPGIYMLGLSYKKVVHFVNPDTNLRLLTLIAKAERQCLDLTYVDPAKLSNDSYNFLDKAYPTTPVKEVDLSCLLKNYRFSYLELDDATGFRSHSEVMRLVAEFTEHFCPAAGLAWIDTEINTFDELWVFLNRNRVT